MVLETAFELIDGALRLIARLFLEVVLEFLCKGVGYFICKQFKKDINPDSAVVLIIGFLFWITVFFFTVFIYGEITQWLEVDRCLDSGNSFDYDTKQCND